MAMTLKPLQYNQSGGGRWIRTTEAFASDLQSDPFDRSGIPPKFSTKKAPSTNSIVLFIYQHKSGRRLHIPRFAFALSRHQMMHSQSGRVFSSATQPMSTIAIKSAIWPEKWSWREESNPRPADYKSAALPTELRQHLSRRSAILEKVRVISNLKCGFFLIFFKNSLNLAVLAAQCQKKL